MTISSLNNSSTPDTLFGNQPTGAKATASSEASNSAATKATERLKDVGKDEFLKLLVVQLQNQDPMSPVKNEEFVAQMATFSSLEQLISIKEAVNKLAEITETPSTQNAE